MPSCHLEFVKVFTTHDRKEALAGVAVVCKAANVAFANAHVMITDDALDHVRLNDVCAQVDAAMATAKLSPSQKKPFQVCISLVEGWSKLSMAMCMTSAASKIFKGDVLVHVSTVKDRLKEAQEILKAKPAEFNLPDHIVHVDTVETIMTSIERQAIQVATDTLFVEFQELEKANRRFCKPHEFIARPAPRSEKLFGVLQRKVAQCQRHYIHD